MLRKSKSKEMVKKKLNKICIKCGKTATIFGKGLPTCCDDCYDKIKAWQAVNLYLPHRFKVTLKEWEHTSVMDALKSNYNITFIDDVEITVANYPNLVKAYNEAVENNLDVFEFQSFMLIVKDVKDYIEWATQVLTKEKGG